MVEAINLPVPFPPSDMTAMCELEFEHFSVSADKKQYTIIWVKKFQFPKNIMLRSGLVPHDDKKCRSVGCSTVHFQHSPAGEENSGNELESGGVVTVLSDLVRVAHAQSTPEKFHTKSTMQLSQA